jgi:hypothetical protein
VFGELIATGSRRSLFIGYALGALLMMEELSLAHEL